MILLLDSNHVCKIQRLQWNLNKVGKLSSMTLGYKIMHGCRICMTFGICGYLHIFKDLFLGVVSRTTSRSESENRFFSNFVNPHLSLVEFLMRFKNAVDLQRYGPLQADNQTSYWVPVLKTRKELERHAGEFILIPIFISFNMSFGMDVWIVRLRINNQ